MSERGDGPPRLTFRCPAALAGLTPPPVPAAQGLPNWLRTMPQRAFSAIAGGEDDTLKRCPPFVDAMTSGFLMPLICDVRVENGEFAWDADLPLLQNAALPRSPMSLHDPGQAAGSPLAKEDRVLVKFHNHWTIEAPDGWSVLFTHPLNRFDLPFETLTGLVDCDRYSETWIQFPAVWRDEGFSGVLERGTPVAQCIPVRRESWTAAVEAMSDGQLKRAEDLAVEIGGEAGIYRRRFRS